MNETDPQDTSGTSDDPTAEIAETQAPVHIEERGLDKAIEKALIEEGERGRE